MHFLLQHSFNNFITCFLINNKIDALNNYFKYSILYTNEFDIKK